MVIYFQPYEKMDNIPKYAEVIKNGTGAYLKNPKAADPAKIVYE